MLLGIGIDTFCELAKENAYVLLFQEFPADTITPIGACIALENDQIKFDLLESSEKDTRIGRYSFICMDTLCEIEAIGADITCRESGTEQISQGDPLLFLRKKIEQYRAKSSSPLLGPGNGALGYVSYDAVRLFENLPDHHIETRKYPDLYCKIHKKTIVFDHKLKKIRIAIRVPINGNPKELYEENLKVIHELRETIHQHIMEFPIPRIDQSVESEITDEEYRKIVTRAKEFIRQGDIFQIVPSRAFRFTFNEPPLLLYRALRILESTPYMFFINGKNHCLLGASPEKLVSVKDGIVETIPLAGTRRRGEGQEDFELEKNLLKDEKEIAEHIMLVDLGRNDIGKVAKIGSVEVKSLKKVERFSNVMHLASIVQGTLKEGLDGFDALFACFPAGTLTGAPKVRAMEIIDELESERRGPYGGAVFSIDGEGNFDSCIAIRTALVEENSAKLQVGAGVVYDSNPEREEQETKEKIATLLNAMKLAHGI